MRHKIYEYACANYTQGKEVYCSGKLTRWSLIIIYRQVHTATQRSVNLVIGSNSSSCFRSLHPDACFLPNDTTQHLQHNLVSVLVFASSQCTIENSAAPDRFYADCIPELIESVTKLLLKSSNALVPSKHTDQERSHTRSPRFLARVIDLNGYHTLKLEQSCFALGW